MSQNATFNHGGHTWNAPNTSSNVTIVSDGAERYNYSSSGRHDGRVYSIDISHTHSFSGNTGGMSKNATGSVWTNHEGLFNSRSLAYNGNIKVTGSVKWCGGDNEDWAPTTMTIDVSHTHTVSGSTGGAGEHSHN